jgi:hydroxymethylpyrimidine/phosphomethylpyrimidine kinase
MHRSLEPSADRIRVVLSIAGSDSGGGAGIQADLKAFARSGVHGTTAITAITAQNTVGVDAIEAVSPEMIRDQISAVARDLGIDAVKIGMVGGVVAAALAGLPAHTPVVLDPVMISESGARLLPSDAEAALRGDLLPRATVVTPNIPEARVLARAGDDATPEELARAIHALGPRAVIVTGGHRADLVDLLFDGERFTEFGGERHPDGAAHGSGCTHSSTLAAQLALGHTLEDAARTARAIASEAVRDGLRELGAGAGPVNVLGLGRGAIIGR